MVHFMCERTLCPTTCTSSIYTMWSLYGIIGTPSDTLSWVLGWGCTSGDTMVIVNDHGDHKFCFILVWSKDFLLQLSKDTSTLSICTYPELISILMKVVLWNGGVKRLTGCHLHRWALQRELPRDWWHSHLCFSVYLKSLCKYMSLLMFGWNSLVETISVPFWCN